MLELPSARLLSVSSHGELALMLHPRWTNGIATQGTLARVALLGGSPRELAGDVLDADWDPAGQTMAVARFDGSAAVLEYPLGRSLYRSGGMITHVRISPAGDRVAFFDHSVSSDTRAVLT